MKAKTVLLFMILILLVGCSRKNTLSAEELYSQWEEGVYPEYIGGVYKENKTYVLEIVDNKFHDDLVDRLDDSVPYTIIEVKNSFNNLQIIRDEIANDIVNSKITDIDKNKIYYLAVSTYENKVIIGVDETKLEEYQNKFSPLYSDEELGIVVAEQNSFLKD
jgi:hypothetical protein